MENKYYLNRRKFLMTTAVFAANAILPNAIAYNQNSSAKPNIILCMADDQGWGDTGYNGHPYIKTPHIDKMSKEGITFTRFYAANAMCSPTRGSVYTGRHPYRYGITFAMKGMLEPNEITITNVLKKHGYTTGHFGKWHMGTLSKKGNDQNRWGRYKANPVRYYCPPWDRDVDVCFVTESKVPTWDPMVHPGKIKPNDNKAIKLKGQPFGNDYFIGPDKKETQNLKGDDSRVIMDRAIPFIQDAVKKGQPFLAVIWFHTPHSPVVAGSKYKEMYKDIPENEQHYYGCITAMDDQVGRLREELKKLNISKNTMFWYCSDNGPARQGSPRHVGSPGNLSGYKLSLLEGGIRVPGILVWPQKFPQPKTITTPCVTTDYFPSILAALNIPLPNDRPYDGINIFPLIKDENSKRSKPIGFIHRKRHAWTEHRYKLYTENSTEYKLYDIIEDPAEKNNIASQKPEILKKMKTDFLAWKKGVMSDLKTVPK